MSQFLRFLWYALGKCKSVTTCRSWLIQLSICLTFRCGWPRHRVVLGTAKLDCRNCAIGQKCWVDARCGGFHSTFHWNNQTKWDKGTVPLSKHRCQVKALISLYQFYFSSASTGCLTKPLSLLDLPMMKSLTILVEICPCCQSVKSMSRFKGYISR